MKEFFSSAARNCFGFLLIGLVVSLHIFVSHVMRVKCGDCSPSTGHDGKASSSSEVDNGQELAVKGPGTAVKGPETATKGQGTAVVRAFGGDADGGWYDYVEYPATENCDDERVETATVVGMSLLVMAVCAFLIGNTCPEYCFRARIDLDRYKKIVVEKECGCAVVYNTCEGP